MGLTAILTFMGILGFGAMLTPGVGFFGQLIIILPQWVTELSHIPAYGLLTWLLAAVLQRHGCSHSSALLVAVAGATCFGIVMELCQTLVPGRVVSLSDVLLNSIGVATASVLIEKQSLSPFESERRSLVSCRVLPVNKE